jgi:hypothetical protein
VRDVAVVVPSAGALEQDAPQLAGVNRLRVHRPRPRARPDHRDSSSNH